MTEPAPLHSGTGGPEGGHAWWARSADDVRLRLACWPGAKGTVIFFTGRAEYIEKYGRTAGALSARGFGFLTLDWRGQGMSDRVSGAMGDVARFTDYQRDAAVLLDAATRRALPRPWLLMSHSMGGGIAVRTLIEGAPVDAAAFVAPMWGLGMTGMRRAAAWGVSTIARHLRQGNRMLPGASPLSYIMNATFEDNDLTSDLESFVHLRRLLTDHPELAVGGPSLRWLSEALREIRWMAHQDLPHLPVVAALGSEERIVHVNAVRALAARWDGARLDTYKGARHEILMEGAAHRERFIDSALALVGPAARVRS